MDVNSTPSPSSPTENKFLHRLLVDAATDYAIYAIDTQGNILTWNKGAELLKGYKTEEVIGRNFSMFYSEEDRLRQHPQSELKQALEKGRYEEESWRTRKDGTKFWANVIITPLRNPSGEHIGFAKVTRDLTERKKAELAMAAEEQKFRVLVETVKDYAILMLDKNGNVTSWNEGARRFKGYEAQEIIGQHFSKFYPPEDIRAKKPEMELEVAQNIGRFEDEGWRVRKDGSRFWANVIITALYDNQGELAGFSKVTRDLSERRKAEEDLRIAYAGLEIRIQQKTAQLEEALRARDEFLSIASHELKTPVTGLKMQVQLTKMRLNKGVVDIEKQIQALTSAEAQIDRLTRLIDDLLDISRIQAGKLSYHFEKLNFALLYNEVLESLGGPLAASAGLSSFIDEELEGYWDRVRLGQVLVNLISNALKYAPGSKIVVFAKQDGPYALISVQDYGPGIALEKRGKIFERFERLGQDRNVGGLGLGLYICKQIITAHGGRIEMKNSPGQGATFVFKIPLDARPESVAQLPVGSL